MRETELERRERRKGSATTTHPTLVHASPYVHKPQHPVGVVLAKSHHQRPSWLGRIRRRRRGRGGTLRKDFRGAWLTDLELASATFEDHPVWARVALVAIPIEHRRHGLGDGELVPTGDRARHLYQCQIDVGEGRGLRLCGLMVAVRGVCASNIGCKMCGRGVEGLGPRYLDDVMFSWFATIEGEVSGTNVRSRRAVEYRFNENGRVLNVEESCSGRSRWRTRSGGKGGWEEK